MSIKVTRACAKARGLGRSAKSLLMALADMADEKGRSFPSIRYLVELTGASRSTIIRALVELVAAGWIDREHRQRKDGSRTSDLITITNHAQEAAARAAMRRLPLVVLMSGGVDKAGDNPVDNPVDKVKSKVSEWNHGQGVNLTPHEQTTLNRYTYQTTKGVDAARADGAASPQVGKGSLRPMGQDQARRILKRGA